MRTEQLKSLMQAKQWTNFGPLLECTRNFHSSVYEGRKFCFRFGVFFFDVIAVAESSSSSVSCVLFLLEDMMSHKNMA